MWDLQPPRHISTLPESDRLLRCHETALWANFCRTHQQQKATSNYRQSRSTHRQPGCAKRRGIGLDPYGVAAKGLGLEPRDDREIRTCRH